MKTVKLELSSFAPNWDKTLPDDQRGKPTDKSKVWALYKDEGVLASGWVPNLWDIKELSHDNRTHVNATLVNIYYMQGSNGGRSNQKRYDSIADYVADPITKQLYLTALKSGMFDRPCGDADKVDKIFNFTAFGTKFTIQEHMYDEILPPEWYSEEFQETAVLLAKADVYPTADEAISNQEKRDDLFGDRFFPVVVYPKDKLEIAKELVQEFKNWSNPLFFEDKVFFGIRAKSCEIWNLKNVYESGGHVLINQEWDWD